MNINEKYNLLGIFEKDFQVMNLEYKGIPVWPLLRQSIILNMERNWTNESINSVGGILDKSKTKFVSFFNFFIKNFINLFRETYLFFKLSIGQNNKVDILFLSGTNAKRTKLDTMYYDVFCDPIIEYIHKKKINKDYIVLESSNEYDYKSPSYHDSINIQLVLHFSQLISFVVSFFGFLKKNKQLFSLTKNLDDFLSNNNIHSKSKTYFSIIFELNHIYILYNIFCKILSKNDTKLTFMISYYGPQGMALCLACKRFNVHSIDIQHGVHGEYHYGYSNFHNFEGSSANSFPNEFWLWGEEDKNILDNCTNKINILNTVTGNLYLQKYLSENTIDRNFEKLIANIQKNFDRIILFSFNEIPTVPNSIFPILKYSSNYWFFRFHPRTLVKNQEKIKKQFITYKNIEFEYSNSIFLFDLLRVVNLHITEMSSIVIEAAHFNVFSLIVSQLGKSYYSDYIKSGQAKYLRNLDEIMSFILSLPLNKSKISSDITFFNIPAYFNNFFNKERVFNDY